MVKVFEDAASTSGVNPDLGNAGAYAGELQSSRAPDA
jgi:hypothetical protein